MNYRTTTQEVAMLNFKKLSQALLLAVGLAFASGVVLFSTSLQAEDNAKNSTTSSNPSLSSGRGQRAQEKAGKASSKSGEKEGAYNTATQNENEKKDGSAAKAQTDLNDYKKEDGDYDRATKAYDKAVENYNKEIEKTRTKGKQDYNDKKQKYEECVKSGGSNCATLLAEMNAALDKYANPEKHVKKENYVNEEVVKAKEKVDQELENKQKAVKEAQKEYDKKQQEYVASEYADIAAQDKVIKAAEKEANKAQKEFEKAEDKAIKACSKNANSEACAKAKKELDEALTKKNNAEQVKEEAKGKKRAAQEKIGTATGAKSEDDIKEQMNSAQLAAEKIKEYADDEREAEENRRNEALNDANKTAQAKDEAYQQKVKDVNQAKNQLAVLKAKCGSSRDGECKNIDAKEGEIVKLEEEANAAYKEKVKADKALEQTTQMVNEGRANDIEDLANQKIENKKAMNAALDQKNAADAALKEAQDKAAKKCKNGKNSKACQKAQEELAAAQDAANQAQSNYSRVQAKYTTTTDVDDARNQRDMLEYKNAKELAEKACDDDNNSQDCKDAQAHANALATELKANAAQRKESKEAEIEALRKQIEDAKKACEYSKKLESKQGQAQAVEYCAQAEQLRKELEVAEKQLDILKKQEADIKSSVALYQNHEGQEFRAFSTAVGNVEDGTYRGEINYTNTDDIFSTVTRRAARIIVGLKPIVYIFAGFGLIAFAFAAIFNKISWKWFANIAIGLFLVANMGRLIEYMVLNTKSGAPQALEEVTEFGNHLHTFFADTEYMWVDIVEPFTPTEEATPDEEKPDTGATPPEKEADERGFCEAEKKGGGLLGGGGFVSCIKDLVASGKKAADAVKKVKNTVGTIKTAVEVATDAAKNIGEAIDKMGSGDIKQMINAVGEIGNNVNAIVASGGNAIRTTMNNTSGITNDIQDATKSREQQNELRIRRDSGEATNAVDAAISGQKWDKDTKSVERLYDGSIASNKKADKNGNFNNNGQTGLEDVVDKVTKGSQSLNNKLQGGRDNVYIKTSDMQGIVRSVSGGK